jgi:S-adenosylmethionine decarboxylase proenzyme
MNGVHLTADLSGCTAAVAAMTDARALRDCCLEAVRVAGLRPVGELFHAFPAPGGVTGAVLLAESHLAVHTWPELGVVTIDAFVCNLSTDNAARAEVLVQRLVEHFQAVAVRRQRLTRGAPGGPAAPPPGGPPRPRA